MTANTSGRDLGSIAAEIEKKISQMKVPEEFTVSLKGARLEQQEAFRNLIFALVLAILLVYMVLASQFASLLHPFLIMFSVPLGFIGVIWALFVTGNTLSVVSFIGIIMMVGIVVSNAIILIDYINRLRKEEGAELKDAIIRAGRIRLRPILMTTLTTICGLIPMALGIGRGGRGQCLLSHCRYRRTHCLHIPHTGFCSHPLFHGRELAPPKTRKDSSEFSAQEFGVFKKIRRFYEITQESLLWRTRRMAISRYHSEL